MNTLVAAAEECPHPMTWPDVAVVAVAVVALIVIEAVAAMWVLGRW